jgi:hypothetical protein
VEISIESDPPPASGISVAMPISGEWRVPRSEPEAAPYLARSEPTEPDVPFAPPTMPFAMPPKLATPKSAKPAQLPLPMPAATPAQNLVNAVHRPVGEVNAVHQIATSVAPAMVSEKPAIAAPAKPVNKIAGAWSRLNAWAIDCGLLFALFCAQLTLTALVTGHTHEWLDLLLSRELRPWWLVLAAIDAVAWSWLFGSIGRTPGMAAQRQHLRTLQGRAPNAAEALQRALLSLISGATALFGFTLALFDRRHQTLHDKLCGCVVTID